MKFVIFLKDSNGQFSIPLINEDTERIILFDTQEEAESYAKHIGLTEFLVKNCD